MRRGKKYLEVIKGIDSEKLYPPGEAITLLKSSVYAKFDETVELHFNLGTDCRHADQQLRGTMNLPNGSGKNISIAVVCKSDAAKEASAAGADFVGSDDLIEKIQKGWLGFDLLISTPDMMSKLGKLGKTLGAKGLMPNPKSGTVTQNLKETVKEFKSGKIEYRNDKNNNLHLVIGKASFSAEKLLENFMAVYDIVVKAKPSKSKGIYLKSMSICSTMCPGIRLETHKVKWKG